MHVLHFPCGQKKFRMQVGDLHAPSALRKLDFRIRTAKPFARKNEKLSKGKLEIKNIAQNPKHTSPRSPSPHLLSPPPANPRMRGTENPCGSRRGHRICPSHRCCQQIREHGKRRGDWIRAGGEEGARSAPLFAAAGGSACVDGGAVAGSTREEQDTLEAATGR